jgi:hypothetical protein
MRIHVRNMAMVEDYRKGAGVEYLGRKYNLAPSTVEVYLRQYQAWRKPVRPKPAKRSRPSRPVVTVWRMDDGQLGLWKLKRRPPHDPGCTCQCEHYRTALPRRRDLAGGTRLTFRVERDLMRKLAAAAKDAGVTVSEIVRKLASEALSDAPRKA